MLVIAVSALLPLLFVCIALLFKQCMVVVVACAVVDIVYGGDVVCVGNAVALNAQDQFVCIFRYE